MVDKNTKNSMEKNKICIIVPVYRVEPYLRQCIDSILAQTFTDYKLILVDDGSPDNCGAICDDYASKDNRIVVIHQENRGVSAARNAGLDWMFAKCDSEWLAFVDSDDWIIPTYLETLHRYTSAPEVDVVATNYTVFSDEQELKNVPQNVVNANTVSGREACSKIYLRDDTVCVCVWGKLFRRKLFENKRFPNGMIHEDDALTPQLLFAAECVTILRAWMYCYRMRKGSIVNSSFSLKRCDRLLGIDACIETFRIQGDGDLAQLAQKFRDEVCATTVLRAYKYGQYVDLPESCRMPIGKAVYLTVCDSIKRGGIKFIFRRINRFFKGFMN